MFKRLLISITNFENESYYRLIIFSFILKRLKTIFALIFAFISYFFHPCLYWKRLYNKQKYTSTKTIAQLAPRLLYRFS